jgi:hypothetical protein
MQEKELGFFSKRIGHDRAGRETVRHSDPGYQSM